MPLKTPPVTQLAYDRFCSFWNDYSQRLDLLELEWYLAGHGQMLSELGAMREMTNPAIWRFTLSIADLELRELISLLAIVSPRQAAVARPVRTRVRTMMALASEPCPDSVSAAFRREIVAVHEQVFGYLPGAVHLEWQRLRKEANCLVFERAGHQCEWCGSSRRLQVDHVYPQSQGGGNYLANFQCLCEACNRKKHKWLVLS